MKNFYENFSILRFFQNAPEPALTYYSFGHANANFSAFIDHIRN